MTTTSLVPPPDISTRPLQCRVACNLAVPPSVVFRAWTEHLDRWFVAQAMQKRDNSPGIV